MIVCENPEHVNVMCWHHKDAKQACPRFYCKMELFQRESKIGEIRQARIGESERSWWEDEKTKGTVWHGAWRRVLLSLNVFFCSFLNLGFLVLELLWNSDRKLQSNTSDWIYSVHLYWTILETAATFKAKMHTKENPFGPFPCLSSFFLQDLNVNGKS